MRSLKSKIQMTIFNLGFIVSVILILILCSTASIYTDSKYNDYSSFTALLYFSRNDMLADTCFSSVEVLRKCGTGWLNLFMPIVATFPWVKINCNKRNTGFVQSELYRNSYFCHDVCEYLSGGISGGLVSLGGFLLYAFAVYLLYPNIQIYDQASIEALFEMQQMLYGKVLTTNYLTMVLSLSARMFAYGFFISSPVIVASVFSNSPYTVSCIPFFLIYAYSQVSTMLLSKGTFGKFALFLRILQPGSLLTDISLKQTILLAIILSIICFVIFRSSIKYRRLKGDCL